MGLEFEYADLDYTKVFVLKWCLCKAWEPRMCDSWAVAARGSFHAKEQNGGCLPMHLTRIGNMAFKRQLGHYHPSIMSKETIILYHFQTVGFDRKKNTYNDKLYQAFIVLLLGYFHCIVFLIWKHLFCLQ